MARGEVSDPFTAPAQFSSCCGGISLQPTRSPSAALGTMTRTNLPISATTFIARTGEIEGVKERLRDCRLLTLTGSGGCGKTRLALEVARQLESDFVDGVWLVELAQLSDPELVVQVVAAALNVREVQGQALLA